MHLEENDTCFSKPGFPKEGFAGLASLCTQRRLALFRLRPKLHLFTHTHRILTKNNACSKYSNRISLTSLPSIYLGHNSKRLHLRRAMEIQLQSGASEIFNPLSYSALIGSTIEI